MAKSKSDLGKLLTIVAAALGVIALVMLFLPAVTAEGASDSYSGLDVVFGKSEEFAGHKIEVFAFSFMNLVTYLLVIAGIVLSVMAFLGKGGGLMPVIAAAAFVVAAIFFFCTVSFVAFPGEYAKEASEAFQEYAKLGAGPIIGGIVSILAAGANVGKIVLK